MSELPCVMRELPPPLPDWERQFIQQGFTVVPGAISAQELEDCVVEMDALILRAELLGKAGVVKVRKSDRVDMEGAGWSWGCDHIFRPELRAQRLLELVSRPPFPQILERILGPRMRFSGGHGHWSPTRYDYYLHWHRDTRRSAWRSAPADSRAHVQVCLALRAESAVWIVPGSHLRELSLAEWEHVTNTPHAPLAGQIQPVIPAGAALFLNTQTLHRAQCHRNEPRRSLHFGFTRVGAARESGREGHVQHWLRDARFRGSQSTFLRSAIDEQIRSDGE